MNWTFWKQQISLSNDNLFFHSSSWNNCRSRSRHQAKPSSLSPRSLFPGVHLSTLPCPSFHVAPSHQQVFKHLQWFSITSFIAYLTPKPSLPPWKFLFRERIALLWLTANNLPDFCHSDSATPLQYGWRVLCHLPCCPQGASGPATWRVLQRAWGAHPLTRHQSLFFLNYSLLVTYYDNLVVNSESTEFNNHWTAHKNLNKVMSLRWGSCGWI